RPAKTLRILGELDEAIVTWFRYAPDEKGPDEHVHHHHTDAFYVLEGQVEFRVGGEQRIAGPRTFVAAPPGAVHGFRVAGSEPIRFLNLHAPPGGFVDRLRA